MQIASNCGKTTSIYEKDGAQYRIINRCNRWDCPICQKQKTSNLKESIEFFQEEYGLYNLLTLTTSSTRKELDNRFKKIMDHLSLCDEKRFISKNKSDIAKYNKYIENIIENEAYFIWLLESKIHSGKDTYIPRVHYALILFDALKYNTLSGYFHSYKETIDTSKYENIFLKKYSSFDKYISLKNTNEKLAYNFYNDFEDLFRHIYNHQTKTAKNKLIAKARKRIKHNINIVKKNIGFQYIRVMEYSKQEIIHYHILTNAYIPYYVLERTATPNAMSSSQVPFEQIKASTGNNDKVNSSSLISYILKDIPSTMEHFHEKKLITCSQGINLSRQVKLNEERNSSTKNIFLGYASTSRYRDTELYTKRKEIYDQFSITRNRICFEFKEEYLTTHPLYFDNADFKKALSKHLNSSLQPIKQRISNELYAFDNNVMVPHELLRHINSPALTDNNHFSKIEYLDEKQNDFLKYALTTKGNIALKGSAGTGKSKCISALLSLIPKDKKVLCCAFTGKAVSHLRDIIGSPSQNVTISTIHQACESDWQQYTHFNHNEYNPLDYDVCIIDEISMIDTFLFYCMINALKNNCKLIVVGDFNQLPPCNNSSVQPFVESNKYFTTVTLTKNYRSDDKINALAYDFLCPFNNEYFDIYNFENALLYAQKGYTILCNTNDICHCINSTMTKDKRRYRIPGRNNFNYKKGQIIMFLKNDTKRGFFNGMTGIITGYNKEKKIITINDTIQLNYRETNLIQPTFSLTIHKAQGSEYDNAVIILSNSPNLLSSAIAYTAITRVKHDIVLMREKGVNEKLLHPTTKSA